MCLIWSARSADQIGPTNSANCAHGRFGRLNFRLVSRDAKCESKNVGFVRTESDRRTAWMDGTTGNGENEVEKPTRGTVGWRGGMKEGCSNSTEAKPNNRTRNNKHNTQTNNNTHTPTHTHTPTRAHPTHLRSLPSHALFLVVICSASPLPSAHQVANRTELRRLIETPTRHTTAPTNSMTTKAPTKREKSDQHTDTRVGLVVSWLRCWCRCPAPAALMLLIHMENRSIGFN